MAELYKMLSSTDAAPVDYLMIVIQSSVALDCSLFNLGMPNSPCMELFALVASLNFHQISTKLLLVSNLKYIIVFVDVLQELWVT